MYLHTRQLFHTQWLFSLGEVWELKFLENIHLTLLTFQFDFPSVQSANPNDSLNLILKRNITDIDKKDKNLFCGKKVFTTISLITTYMLLDFLYVSPSNNI